MSMMDIPIRILFLGLVGLLQTVRPSFEVASIRPSTGAAPQAVAAAGRVDGAQFRIAGLTIKDYISMAYAIKLNQISGPDWITTDRFDISATLPEGSQQAQVPDMMQTLLEERFQLKFHREKKDFPVYGLQVASGGLKMKEVSPDPETDKTDANAPQTFTRNGSGQGIAVNLGHGSSFHFADNKLETNKLTMQSLAGALERFLDRPVVDLTGAKGYYDASFDLTPEDYRVMLIRAAVAAGLVMSPDALRVLDGSPSPASLIDGLAKAGLKLEPRRAPLDVLVVDSARRTPTEN
jgi:uncharacterized protein (TIGR03435 family)